MSEPFITMEKKYEWQGIQTDYYYLNFNITRKYAAMFYAEFRANSFEFWTTFEA